MLTTHPSDIHRLREDLRRLEPPYLLRKYEATGASEAVNPKKEGPAC